MYVPGTRPRLGRLDVDYIILQYVDMLMGVSFSPTFTYPCGAVAFNR